MAHPRTTAPASARDRSPAADVRADADTIAAAPAPLLLVEDSDGQRLDRLLQDFGDVDGYSAKLERIRTPGCPAELCGHLQAMPFGEEFLDDVREEHGGGRFRARIYDRHKNYKTSFSFTIAGAPRAPRESETAASVGVGPASAGDSRLERMVEALTGTVGSLVATMTTKPAEDELDRFTKWAHAMRELSPVATTPAATSPLETIRTFLDLQEMLDERAPRGSDNTGLGAVVEHGIKPIAQLMTRSLDIQERAMQRADQRRGVPTKARAGDGEAPGNVREPTNSDTPASDGEGAARTSDGPPVYQLARSIPAGARAFLARQAAADRDPDTYAVLVLDTLDENSPDVYAAMPELVRQDDFLTALLAEVPQWVPYPEWFGRLVDALRMQLSDDDDDTDVTPSPSAGATE